MFLQIPGYAFAGYGFAQFCDHVIDHSPVFTTRTLLRLGFKARECIAEARDGIAEIPDDAGELFMRACAEAPIPRLTIGLKGDPSSEEPVPARAYDPFYAAVEAMSKERPTEPPAVENA